MPVCEAQARMTEAEFTDWQLFFEYRNELAEKQREGLSMHDSDNAEDLTPSESAQHVHTLFSQVIARRTK